MSEHAADERPVTVPLRSVLADVMLHLISAGARRLREHPDERTSEPDVVDVISAGCRYLREQAPGTSRGLPLDAPGAGR